MGGKEKYLSSFLPQQRFYFPGQKILWQQQNNSRPPLNTLIQNHIIVGNVQFLLDFAIIGFGKAGTTTLMDWLAALSRGDNASVAIFSREVYHLVNQRPDALVQTLYEDLPAGNEYLRGYKNPLEVTQRHVLDYYRVYWPKTKLVLGIRHPVRWFESLFNFRVQNLLPGQEMPDPNHLIGRCYPGSFNTCTEKGNFAYYLLQLGKTNDDQRGSHHPTSSPLAERIVGRYQRLWFNVSETPYLPNPVFLYHMEQMQEESSLARELGRFLGLDSDKLPPLPHRKPGLEMIDPAMQQEKDDQKIDICDPAYRGVRRELVRMGTVGAQWIQEEFLASRTVHVSNPAWFRELLAQWSLDPCNGGGGAKVATAEHRRRSPPKNDPVIQAKQLHFRPHLLDGKRALIPGRGG